jgi:Pentapeptide repeats (8 copies)
VYKSNPRFLAIYPVTILLIIGTIALGVWGLWTLPQQRVDTEKSLTPKEKIEFENTTRNSFSQALGTLSQTAGGMVLIIGVYFTWRNLIATEEKQVTERFTKAIDQLGSDKTEICIGGIYALERIANDSERDHWVVMEVLSSFIRERSYLDKNHGNQKTISREVQAALTVIKRRDISKDSKQGTLDLSSTYLKGANLRGESFRVLMTRKENFIKSNLRGINFTGSNLEGADFTGANLSDACFVKASLNRTKFMNANLSKADFTDALIKEANFRDAILFEAKGLNIAKA